MLQSLKYSAQLSHSLLQPYSCIRLLYHSLLYPTLATPWTVARQAPLSMGFRSHRNCACVYAQKKQTWGLVKSSISVMMLTGKRIIYTIYLEI